MGLDAEEIVGRDFYELLHDDDRFKLEKTLEKTLAQAGATASVDLRVRHRAGHDLQIEALLNNLVDDPVVGGVVVNSRDVTERLRFEAAIQRERKLFQQLFSNSPAGIVILDHGAGLNSAFIHMSRLAVTEGDEVEQGQLLGNVGASGRATGPHLHWSLMWRNSRLDPLLFLPPMP